MRKSHPVKCCVIQLEDNPHMTVVSLSALRTSYLYQPGERCMCVYFLKFFNVKGSVIQIYRNENCQSAVWQVSTSLHNSTNARLN
jgi:hypothetical protein